MRVFVSSQLWILIVNTDLREIYAVYFYVFVKNCEGRKNFKSFPVSAVLYVVFVYNK